MPLKYKLKGAYNYPDPFNYAKSISEMQPPGWHRDWGNMVSVKAAVASMVYDVHPETFIRAHTDCFDFMLKIKVNRSDMLLFNKSQIQKTSRYYVAKQGGQLVKVAPPPAGCEVGTYKRASKIPDPVWRQVNAELAASGNAFGWDARIHTKNKSLYEMRETAIEAGYQVAICNDVNDFQFDNINVDWYVMEARKLIIAGV